MNHTQTLNRNLETIAWGLLFIFWGVSIFFDRIPFGIGLAGTGMILLGLNAVRALKGIPIRSFTTVLGILALVWGGLELARPIAGPILHLPFPLNDWAIFSILLIVLGVIFLIGAIHRVRKMDFGESHQSKGV